VRWGKQDMFKNPMIKLTLVTIALLTTTSCATRKVVSTPDDLNAVLKNIPVGQSRQVTLVGELRPYSGSFPKGSGLSEIAVGSETILIRTDAIHKDREAPYLNKTVTARVKISHFPLPDSNPASQIAGPWITEISELKLKE
jgi:hypothetical protein